MDCVDGPASPARTTHRKERPSLVAEPREGGDQMAKTPGPGDMGKWVALAAAAAAVGLLPRPWHKALAAVSGVCLLFGL